MGTRRSPSRLRQIKISRPPLRSSAVFCLYRNFDREPLRGVVEIRRASNRALQFALDEFDAEPFRGRSLDLLPQIFLAVAPNTGIAHAVIQLFDDMR